MTINQCIICPRLAEPSMPVCCRYGLLLLTAPPQPLAIRWWRRSTICRAPDRPRCLFATPKSPAPLSRPMANGFVRKPYSGVMNIWVKAVDAPFGAARPCRRHQRPRPALLDRGQSIRVIRAGRGRDRGPSRFRGRPFRRRRQDDRRSAGARPHSDGGIRAVIYAVPEENPAQIVVGVNDRDRAARRLPPRHRYGSARAPDRDDTNVSEWVTDLAGVVRLAMRQRPDGGPIHRR